MIREDTQNSKWKEQERPTGTRWSDRKHEESVLTAVLASVYREDLAPVDFMPDISDVGVQAVTRGAARRR